MHAKPSSPRQRTRIQPIPRCLWRNLSLVFKHLRVDACRHSSFLAFVMPLSHQHVQQEGGHASDQEQSGCPAPLPPLNVQTMGVDQRSTASQSKIVPPISQPPSVVVQDAVGADIPASKKRRRVVCPLCHQEGHMAKTCHREHKPLPPDVDDLPYEQRKHAILNSSTIPSVIELAPTSQQLPMSPDELLRLVERLNKHPNHVTHLNLSNNSLEAVKFRLQAPFTRLTALKQLVLSCKP